MSVRQRLVLAAAFAVALVGCAADRPLRVRIGKDVVRPERAVVVFFVDGFGEVQLDDALAEGRVPNIRRHLLDRGVRAASVVSCIPSITYANSVTFLTGRFPGRHGIVSNKWFEPSTGRFQNYCFIKTYQQVDADYQESPTIYEILNDHITVSIQAAMRRGCTHTIDNWATSGINWFFGNITGVDCLVAQRFELIAEHSARWGQWPDFIWVYFPGTDNIGHRFGPGSISYKRAVANVDRQIGRICAALQDIGMYERTNLCLVSDHGMAPVEADAVLDVAGLLREEAGARVWLNRYTRPGEEAELLGAYDYAVATTASRWTAVYPLSGRDGVGDCETAAFSRALSELESGEGGDEGVDVDARALMPRWLRVAVEHPAVELAACCFRPGRVHLFRRDGYAQVVRTAGPPERHQVWQRSGAGVLPEVDLALEGPAAGASDSRAWLRASVGWRYPDLVPQIVAMFDSERAGNIVFFASDGWDFSTEDPAGGHGSVLPMEMRVPMVFSGPGIPAGGTIPYARTCDLMPTVLGLLGASPVLADGTRVDMDGINLLAR